MFVYYCQNCNDFKSFVSKTGGLVCPSCGKEYLCLGISVEEWNEYSNDEMILAIERAKGSIPIKRPVFPNSSSACEDGTVSTERGNYNEQLPDRKQYTKRILVGVVGEIAFLGFVLGCLLLFDKTQNISREKPDDYYEDVTYDDKESSTHSDVVSKNEESDEADPEHLSKKVEDIKASTKLIMENSKKVQSETTDIDLHFFESTLEAYKNIISTYDTFSQDDKNRYEEWLNSNYNLSFSGLN